MSYCHYTCLWHRQLLNDKESQGQGAGVLKELRRRETGAVDEVLAVWIMWKTTVSSLDPAGLCQGHCRVLPEEAMTSTRSPVACPLFPSSTTASP